MPRSQINKNRTPRPGHSSPQSQLRRAQHFRETRRHHSTEAAEDYTELILDLVEKRGEARVCTIAQELGVSHVTAIRTIQRLQEEGYMITKPHKPVELTKMGERTARYAKERHRILVQFLVSIGVPLKTAETDVEGAEHHISNTTLLRVKEFLKNRGMALPK